MNDVKEWVTGEVDAKNYLIKEGFRILYENYSNPLGEIDLIAIDPKARQLKKLKQQLDNGNIAQRVYERFAKMAEDVLVFVEVKSRATDKFGNALYAIDQNKIMKICQVANAFLKSNFQYKKMQARFDCIGITAGKLTHIENAFDNIYG